MAEDRDLGLPGSAVPTVWSDLSAICGDVFRTFVPGDRAWRSGALGVYGEEKPEFHVL